MTRLTTIAFDADDTLWHNERFFKKSERHFAGLLADFADEETVYDKLIEAERRNVGIYGFGIKGFTLSMLETATTMAGDHLPPQTVRRILDLGKAMLDHPVEVFEGVEETLKQLAADFSLMLITKGDLFDQERKLVESGLQDHFDHVEIVSDKTPETYRRIFDRHGQGTARAMMVGNSLKSDILPPLEVGSWGIYIPHGHTWALEHADEPAGHTRFRKAGTIGEMPGLVAEVISETA